MNNRNRKGDHMPSIMQALEKLDSAVGRLVSSVEHAEKAAQAQDHNGNIVDVDFVAQRLDYAIEAVEGLLKEGEKDYAASES